MSSIQLLVHSKGRLYPWVFPAPEVPLRAGARWAGSVAFAPEIMTMWWTQTHMYISQVDQLFVEKVKQS